MSLNTGQAKAIARLRQSSQAVLVVDVCNSVRLIEQAEQETITRWLAILSVISDDILPEFGGRMVKSLGDGLLAQFQDPKSAVNAALAIHNRAASMERDAAEGRRIELRVGITVSDVFVHSDDIFGHGVNLAARFADLGTPNETIVSQAVRDAIVQDVDADILDLGLCALKNVSEPVRAFRLASPDRAIPPAKALFSEQLLPKLAILPFDGGPQGGAIGEVVADALIERFSKSANLTVISRLSSFAFSAGQSTADQIFEHLDTHYLVSGRVWVIGDRARIALEAAARDGFTVVYSETYDVQIKDLHRGLDEVAARIAGDVMAKVFTREIRHAQLWPMKTLESYTLLLGAIGMMHRNTPQDFQLAQELISELMVRWPRHPAPRAWLAYWHVVRVHQGWSASIDQDSALASAHADSALEIDPECEIALVTNGLVNTHFTKRFDIAMERYDAAVAANRNFALGWLLRGTTHAFLDAGALAMADTSRARELSPLDPQRYYYDSLSATACLAAGEDEEALALSKRSLKANRQHASTLRVKLAAEWRLGLEPAARETLQDLTALEPDLTVSGWLERTPTAEFKLGREFAQTLRQLGVPE